MKEYAEAFYKSRAWVKTQKLYMESIHYVCERCGGIAKIVHHKKYITPKNITDPEITLNFDNLEGLCQDCHNKEHTAKVSRAVFDANGNMIAVKESREMQEYKKALEGIERCQHELCRTD